MILVDTSIWIEFFKKHEPYFTELRELIEASEVITHAVIFGELLQGCKSKTESDLIEEYWRNLEQINNPESFIEAGKLSSSLKLIDKGIGLIDAVLMYHSRFDNHKLWTLDKKILKLLKKNEIYSL